MSSFLYGSDGIEKGKAKAAPNVTPKATGYGTSYGTGSSATANSPGNGSTIANASSTIGSTSGRVYVKSVDVATSKPARVTINGIDAEDLSAFDSTWNYRKTSDEYDPRVS